MGLERVVGSMRHEINHDAREQGLPGVPPRGMGTKKAAKLNSIFLNGLLLERAKVKKSH